LNENITRKEPTKIHDLLVEAIAKALQDIFQSGRHADKVVEYYLKNQRKWGSRDRRFFAEAIYEIVRWWRYLWWLRGEEPRTELAALKTLWAYWWAWNHGEPPEGFLAKVEMHGLKERLNQDPAPEIGYSMPDWLQQKGIQELGADWNEALPYLNKPARVYLRANTLKTSAEKLAALLREEGVETTLVSSAQPEVLVLQERKNVFITKAYLQGLFEVQDWSSQHVAPYLDVAPGMRVIDACAGAGGKSLHIAALMKNKGKIISMDIHEWKLKELRTRASRDGVDIIEVKLIEGQKTIKRLIDSADRVLLDVPCSGIGVLRRNPDTKWKLRADELIRLNSLQQEILSSYAKMVKPGGKLVYSTCSIFPSENQMQVVRFLESNPDFRLEKQKTFMPQENDWDGFYAALLTRQKI
jgi:16S rRNA (cytosine967-C5)-methyltransferase